MDVFCEFMKSIPELNELIQNCQPDGKYKYLKLFTLKALKIIIGMKDFKIKNTQEEPNNKIKC
jgi:hypothetical protein